MVPCSHSGCRQVGQIGVTGGRPGRVRCRTGRRAAWPAWGRPSGCRSDTSRRAPGGGTGRAVGRFLPASAATSGGAAAGRPRSPRRSPGRRAFPGWAGSAPSQGCRGRGCRRGTLRRIARSCRTGSASGGRCRRRWPRGAGIHAAPVGPGAGRATRRSSSDPSRDGPPSAALAVACGVGGCAGEECAFVGAEPVGWGRPARVRAHPRNAPHAQSSHRTTAASAMLLLA